MPPPRRLPMLGHRLPDCRSAAPLESGEFVRTLAREIVRSERSGAVVSLMVLQMDQALPEDLQGLLDFLQERLRLSDEVGWLDEQNLGILLPATTGSKAQLLAESVAQAMGEASSRIPWHLLSSDQDPAVFAGMEDRRNPSSPPDEDDEGGGGSAPERGLPSRPVPVRSQVEPLSPLFLVPLARGKRALDVACSSLALILLSPLLALVALAVRLDSPGPVLFRQKRVGQGGRVFELLKFRTMVEDAEARLAALKSSNHRDGPAFKIENDPRITRVGRWIRGNAIDELPQLWNVLMGDMTLVGPRPPLPREVAHYESWQRARLRVVGGLTCIWQVDGRLRNVPFADWMRQDIRYGTRYSARRDFALIARTAWVVLTRRGDR